MSSLKLRPTHKLHIACDDLDLSFTRDEVLAFRREWWAGTSLYTIAERLNRHPDEIAILALDQARVGYIEQRPGGALGSEQ